MSWLMVQLLACWANNANHYAFNLGWVVRTPMLQDVKRCVCVPQGFALSWFLAWRQNGTLRAARNPKKRRIKEVVSSRQHNERLLWLGLCVAVLRSMLPVSQRAEAIPRLSLILFVSYSL
jgi:hypothetical protein